jgi:hypothetical protein
MIYMQIINILCPATQIRTIRIPDPKFLHRCVRKLERRVAQRRRDQTVHTRMRARALECIQPSLRRRTRVQLENLARPRHAGHAMHAQVHVKVHKHMEASYVSHMSQQAQNGDAQVTARRTLLQKQRHQHLWNHQARQQQRVQLRRLLRRYRKKGDGRLLRKNYEM